MLRINIGFSRKAGEANYGSRGASVNLELELDSGLAAEPDRLKDRIRFLFGLAKASVEEELNGQATNGHSAQSAPARSDGQTNGRQRDSTRRATASQIRALHAIAKRQDLDVSDVVRSRYGADKPEDLSIIEASELIDSLKSASNGAGGRR